MFFLAFSLFKIIYVFSVSFICVCDFSQKFNGFLRTDLPSSLLMDWSKLVAP